MTHLNTFVKALKLTWISRFFQSEEADWKDSLSKLLSKWGGVPFFLHCNFILKEYKIDSMFYMNILKCWSEIRNEQLITADKAIVIWNNDLIRVGGK